MVFGKLISKLKGSPPETDELDIHDFGNWGEKVAKTYMQSLGAMLVASNFSCKFGEIDLIFYYEDALVFVEVRTRSTDQFMKPVDSIDHKKQKRIKKTAEYYYTFVWQRESLIQFDVIAIVGKADDYELDHIARAFE